MTACQAAVPFFDLGPASFPFTVKLIAPDGSTAWSWEMAGPGALVIPGRDELGPGPFTCRITWGDGKVSEAPR